MKQKTTIIYIFSLLFVLILTACADTLIGEEGSQEEGFYLNYRTITDLELPFEGEWVISVGGRTHEGGGNHFFARQSGQRYAYDIFKVVDGQAYTGNGGENEDTYTFGARLNAPGDGKIIALENNIEDNYRPGIVNDNINDSNLAGNYIMIDHLNGEYSLMAHFKKGTIIVSVGDTVNKGQEVGKAGNSGNSTGPHLHYHLQNSPTLLDGIGLPAQFRNYYEDNVFTERGEPVKYQIISND